jgi:long-chain acyl-CoA synthetase
MLGELLTSAAQAQPDKPAVIVPTRTVSYRKLDAQAHALALALHRLGLRAGDRVAFQLPNGVEAAICYFACFKAGLIGVPCNTRLTAHETRFVLDHSQARVYIGCREWYDRFSRLAMELPLLEHVVLIDREDLPTGALSFHVLAGSNGKPLAALFPIDQDAGALILYTSGTSARPKGVLHTHASLGACVRLWVEAAGLGPDERVLLMSPMMHMSGMGALLTTVSVTGTAAIVPPMDPAAALDALEQFGCTHTFGLPLAYHLLVREQQRQPRRVGTLRSALGGGDCVTSALIDAFQSVFGIPIQEGHGMSECVPNLVNSRAQIKPGSLGRPVPGVEARIDAAPGRTGELLLRSPGMFLRYWRDPDETRRAFEDGFLRTGDLARADADGFFWFAGRRKEIIVHGGANVSPQEVEDALCLHPAVALAGVFGVPDPVWGETIHAAVVPKNGSLSTGDELRDFLAVRLAEWKMPASITLVPDLPIGPTGKVQRRLLRERMSAAAAASTR